MYVDVSRGIGYKKLKGNHKNENVTLRKRGKDKRYLCHKSGIRTTGRKRDYKRNPEVMKQGGVDDELSKLCMEML